MAPENKKNLNAILVVLLLLAIAALLVVKNKPQEEQSNVVIAQEGGVTTSFPPGLPLESKYSESYKQEYIDEGVVVHGYTYFTEKTPAEVVESYKDYIAKNVGVRLSEGSTNSELPHYLIMRVASNELKVVINADEMKTVVQVVYTVKANQ